MVDIFACATLIVIKSYSKALFIVKNNAYTWLALLSQADGSVALYISQDFWRMAGFGGLSSVIDGAVQ